MDTKIDDAIDASHRLLAYILSGNKEVPPKGIIDRRVLAYQRGRKMRREGKPCPPKPGDDDTDDLACSLWIGYRIEIATEHFKACDVAERLGMPRPDFKE